MMMATGAAVVAALAPVGPAAAEDDGVFGLGEIHVSAPAGGTQETDDFGGSTLSGSQMETFAADTVDEALNLVPGVVGTGSGDARNERVISVRGFSRLEVPLSIDGVQIYLPADNRFDFGRFLTPDVAAVQVAKGYVSVLDGPGGMGGAINLVSYKPTKELEAEGRAQAEFGTDGTFEGTMSYLRAGSRKENGYVQASGTYRDMRGWMLSESFNPTAVENGGLRDHSDTRDWSVNLKAGYTPNATDEYSINLIKQSADKGSPYHVTNVSPTRPYRDWPQWNIQNLYWLSDTQIGEASYLKTKLYYNTFDNTHMGFDNPEQTIRKTARSFNTYYDDFAVGGNVEAGTDIGRYDTLKLAFSYRRDDHTEWNESFGNRFAKTAGCTANVICFTEPKQNSVEDTFSTALENTIHLTPAFDLVQGVSYNWRDLSKAEDFSTDTGAMVYFPLNDSDAIDYQGAAVWRYSETAKVFANFSHRTRFPTLFERFSSKFSQVLSNPELAPEEATNYQLGWSNAFAPKSQMSVTAFYSDVEDMIQSVQVDSTHTQSQNVGDGYFYGAEASLDYAIADRWTVGGNLTWIRREVTNPDDPNFRPSGVPEFKGLVFVTWQPYDNLKLTPSVEFADDRWTSYTVGNANYYYTVGAYTLVNFRAEYAVNANFTVAAGARNLLDQDYYLSDGYPEAGRSFYASLKATF
ncbi:Vitamin B12 transporter BtuB [Blastochloris viridis]|uniref:Enterobactin receptor protein n=2 Tax=Blastochloris viridis TaxID=1079 RepID=A0A0H5BF74_BLAVI|nr:Vitamin B12 transporter BtuB [Blastochloris viridis]BAS00863.1 tonB-dependent receptor [Blastochloris viridis]CUU41928.1 enterobactin receptor protein [Blastochloris viridis]